MPKKIEILLNLNHSDSKAADSPEDTVDTASSGE